MFHCVIQSHRTQSELTWGQSPSDETVTIYNITIFLITNHIFNFICNSMYNIWNWKKILQKTQCFDYGEKMWEKKKKKWAHEKMCKYY